jgi:hypothetical protein
MRYLMLVLLVIGCYEPPKDSKGRRINDSLNEICLNGVVYYDFYEGKTVKFLPNSKVEVCNEKQNRSQVIRTR